MPTHEQDQRPDGGDERPSPDEHAENVAAFNAAIEDFKTGDRGQPAGDLSRELREKLRQL